MAHGIEYRTIDVLTARIHLVLDARVDVKRLPGIFQFLVQHVGPCRHGLRPQEFFVPFGVDFRAHDSRHVIFEVHHVHDQEVSVPDRDIETSIHHPLLPGRIRGWSLYRHLQSLVCRLNRKTVALYQAIIDLQLMPLWNNGHPGRHVDPIA